MADIPLTLEATACGDMRVYSWLGMTENDPGQPITVNGDIPVSIQVEGSFGTGGVVGLSGSNTVSGAFYLFRTLSTFSANGISPINESALRIQPLVTEGTGVLVDVYILIREC